MSFDPNLSGKAKCVGGPLDGKEFNTSSELIEEDVAGWRRVIYSLHDGAFRYDPDGLEYRRRAREGFFRTPPM